MGVGTSEIVQGIAQNSRFSRFFSRTTFVSVHSGTWVLLRWKWRNHAVVASYTTARHVDSILKNNFLVNKVSVLSSGFSWEKY